MEPHAHTKRYAFILTAALGLPDGTGAQWPTMSYNPGTSQGQLEAPQGRLGGLKDSPPTSLDIT